MIKKLIPLAAIFLIASLLLFSGCSPKSETEKLLDTAFLSENTRQKKYEDLESRLLKIVEALNSEGIDTGALSFEMADLKRSHLGWKILTEESVSYTWNPKSLETGLSDLQMLSAAHDVQEILHFSPEMALPSPLFSAMADWSDHQLILWLLREYTRLMDGNQIKDRSLLDFWVYKCTEVVLTGLKGTTSLEVAQFKNVQYDRIAWASQVVDLQTQLGALHKPQNMEDQESYNSDRNRLYQAWLRDYRDQYQSRFLTNEFKSFGDSQMSDLMLADLNLDGIHWPEYQQLWNELGESLEELTFLVFNRQ